MDKKSRKASAIERELEKKKKRQEMYLNAMDDLTLLRNHYKAEVRKKLEVKVIQQRKEQKQRAAVEKAEEEKLLKQKQMHSFKVHLPKSEDTEDETFLKNVQLSKLYVVMAIRNKLEKNGDFEKKFKIEEFNKLIFKPGMIDSVRRDICKGKNITFARLQQLEAEGNNERLQKKIENRQRPLSTIADDEETMSKIEESKEFLKSKRNSDAKNIPLEVLFPSLPYPKLPAINKDLDESIADPEKIERQLKIEKRKRNTEERKWLVEKMYQQSLAYKTATERLVKKYEHLNFTEDADTNDANDIIMMLENENYNESVQVTEAIDASIENKLSLKLSNNLPNTTETNRYIYDYLESLDNFHISDRHQLFDINEESYLEERPTVFEDRVSSHHTQKLQWEGKVYCDDILKKQILGIVEPRSDPSTIAPLTMESLEKTAPVKVVKGASSTWVNPL